MIAPHQSSQNEQNKARHVRGSPRCELGIADYEASRIRSLTGTLGDRFGVSPTKFRRKWFVLVLLAMSVEPAFPQASAQLLLAGGYFWPGEEGTNVVRLMGTFVSEEVLISSLRLDSEIGEFLVRPQSADEKVWTLRDVLVSVDLNVGGSSAVWVVAGPRPLIADYVERLNKAFADRSLFIDFGTRELSFDVPRD